MSHEQDTRDDDAIDPDLIEHTWECDFHGCNASTEHCGSYMDAWKEAKEEGWKCRNEGGNWKHYCSGHAR